MEITKKITSDWIKKDGCWEKNGVVFPRVAKIRAHKLLKRPEFCDYFKPDSFVHYCPVLISREEIGEGQFVHLASVKNVEGKDTVCRAIPLALLEFTFEQKEEIIKANGFPKSAFDKLPPVIQEDRVLDNPFLVELDGLGGPDDEYLGVGSNYGF